MNDLSYDAILLYNKLKSGKVIKRTMLCKTIGTTDRHMREVLAELKRHYPICNTENGSGYFIATTMDEARRQLKKENKRAREIIFNTMGLKKFLKLR